MYEKKVWAKIKKKTKRRTVSKFLQFDEFSK